MNTSTVSTTGEAEISKEATDTISAGSVQDAKKVLPRHSFELRRRAMEIFQSGGSYKNCARILNIPLYTARDWFRCYSIGTFRTEHGARQQKYTPEQKEAVLTLRQQGASYNKISKMTKVNRATVLQWVHQERDRQAKAVQDLL